MSRVLIIEDDARLAAAIARGLLADGFTAEAVGDGQEGLQRARSREYDALVLDIMLPTVNGYEVCRRLREAEVWIPILMLTAKDGEYDEADALDLGADDYLTKPFSYVVLTARLHALIRRGRPARPTVLTAGDLVVDPGARTCRRGDQQIALTAREFAVLEFLIRRHGQVVTKTDILTGVWDAYDDRDVNIVEVYLGYLRRKIDVPFGRRGLETVRGVGYRLAGDGG